MSESRLKENATAVKKLFGTAAKLAQKQAALATLNNVTLPKIYHAIGKKIVGLDKLPPDLVHHREKIRALEAQIARKPVEPTAAPTEGFAAKAKQLAQQAAQKTSKASSDAAATMQIHAAYVSLGKAAAEKYGDTSVPKEILPELQTAKATISQLQDEIAALSASSHHGVLTPSRLLLVGGISAAVVLCVVLLRSFQSDESRVEDGSSAQAVATSRDAGQPASKEASLADAIRANTDGTRVDLESSEAVARFQSQAQRELSKWQEAAEELKGSLLREPSLLTVKSEEDSDAWGDLAARKSQELEETYRDMWERLRSDLQKRSGDENSLAAASPKDLAASLSAFAAACAKERAQLTRVREKAIADIVTFRAEIAEKRQSAVADIAKLVQAEKARWEKATKPLREPLATDAAVKSLKKPIDAEGLERLAKDAQTELSQTIQQQQEATTRELDSIREESERRLRGARTQGDAEATAKAAQQRASQAISDSVSRMTAQRHHGIKVLADFIAMEQHKKAEDMQNAVLAGRSFTGRAGLTDDALRRVLAEAPNVTDLFLQDSPLLTNACIPEIAKLRDVRTLRLPPQCGITADGLGPLRGKKVSEVHLPVNIFASKEGFDIFASMLGDASLTGPKDSLNTSSSSFGGRWDLYELTLGDDCVQSLRGVHKVTVLGTPKDVTDAGLVALSAIPDLETLFVTLNPQVTDKGVTSIAKCRGLKRLTLIDDRSAKLSQAPHKDNRGGSSVSAEGLRALRGLESLDLPSCLRTEASFPCFLSALTPVVDAERFKAQTGESLNAIALSDQVNIGGVTCWPFTKTAIKAMAGKRGIRELQIEACTCDDEMLTGIGDIPDLEKLVLKDVSGFQGKGLRGLGRAKKLAFVTVAGCGSFGDEGLRAIAECVNLHTVDLSATPRVTDDGLMSLTACKTMRILRIRGTAATPAIEVKLENALPKLGVGYEE